MGNPVRPRVLVVDDDEDLTAAMARLLRGCEVTCERDPVPALARLEAGQRYDAVLLDQTMPNMTGSELYRKLLASSPLQAERVAFVTGGSLEGDLKFLRDLGRPVLAKPFEVAALRELVSCIAEGGTCTSASPAST